MLNVLITGASGFVGSALVDALRRAPCFSVTGTGREHKSAVSGSIRFYVVQNIGLNPSWAEALDGQDVVIHTAARVHVMDDKASDPLAEFRRVNVDGALHLARQAAAAGTKRFVFLSSIKVNGETTELDKPFLADDLVAPADPYGISKMEAELGLLEIAARTGMEVVIIRPPLVYGPGVRANFLAMMSWLWRGIPLPLGAIHNRRSFVALDNLVDLIVTCIDHPAAANQTFLVSDGEDISTTELLRRLGDALHKPAHLVPMPMWMIEAGVALLGKRDLSQRLCGNLQVDISKARDLLGWSPPLSVDEGLRRVAAGFLNAPQQRK